MIGVVAGIVTVGLLLGAVGPLAAATVPTGLLHRPHGPGATLGNGDYVTQTGGLNAPYLYYIEVPAGLSRLEVDLYDADWGVNSDGQETTDGLRDVFRGGGFNSSVTYTLRNPAGAVVATLNGDTTGPAGADAAWLQMYAVNNPTAGHWELEVDTFGGDDINGFGVRAHDGDPGAGGTEVPVYADSFIEYGTHGQTSLTYTHYPWIVSGCSAAGHDFDLDGAGSISFTSPSGSYNPTFTSVSGGTVWNSETLTGFLDADDAADYGIWTHEITVTNTRNQATFYVGGQAASAAPPSSQPETGAVRLYLGTDAGAAPAKPFFTQQARVARGPNPPQAGQTTVIDVTLRVVNPSAHPITFDGVTRRVEAVIPGGAVVFEGAALANQGTILTTPPVGSGGAVEWNPGTVASGTVASPTVALLFYRLEVTPSSSGQTLNLTGSFGSAATRAVWLDETGNTSQARATVTADLCELTVTEGVLTRAVLDRLDGFVDRGPGAWGTGGGVVLEWETAGEDGTAGFLVRRDGEAVSRVLPARPGAPQGSVYRFADPGASPTAPHRWELVEIETDGTAVLLGHLDGPATGWETAEETDRRPDGGDAGDLGRDRSAPENGFAAFPRSRSRSAGSPPAPEAQLRPAVDAPRFGPSGDAGGEPVLEIGVEVEGWVLVPWEAIGDALGLAPATARERAAAGRLSLVRSGLPGDGDAGPVAYEVTATGLRFHGRAAGPASRPFDRHGVHVLAAGNGERIEVGEQRPQGRRSVPVVETTVRTEEDVFAGLAAAPDPSGDLWFSHALTAGDPDRSTATLVLAAEGVAPTAAEPARLTVRLHGASTVGVAGEHRVRVSLGDDGNGTFGAVPVGALLVGTIEGQGRAPLEATFTIDAADLAAAVDADGRLPVHLEAVLPDGVPQAFVYVDEAELTYRRTGASVAAALDRGETVHATALGTTLRLRGLARGGVDAVDLGDPNRPVRLWSWILSRGGGLHEAWIPTTPGAPIVLAPPTAGAPAARLEARRTSPLADPADGAGRRADLLVVTAEELLPGAEAYAEARRAAGLAVEVVTVEETMDAFRGGLRDPWAIRDLLAHARAHWSVAPRWLLLAGTGTFDPRDVLGLGGDLVPTVLERLPEGLFAADARLGDLDGDGLPEVPVGRLPATSIAELEAHAATAEALHRALLEAPDPTTAPPWLERAVLVGDAPEAGADFAARAEGVAVHLAAGRRVATVRVADGTPAAAAAAGADLTGRLASGAALVHYVGHGALDRWSRHPILAAGQVPRLGAPSLVTAMTCTVNRFEIPGHGSLGGELLAAGAAAVWSPSSVALYGEASDLADDLYRRLETTVPAAPLGDAILATLERAVARGVPQERLVTLVLLGDPSLVLPRPPGPPPTRSGDS